MGRTSGRRCPMYQQWCIIIRTTSFAVECSLAFVCVVWAACVSTTSNCLAHHILSVVALPYAPRPSESPYAMSSSSPTPLFHPPSFLSYSSRLLYSLHLPFTPSPLPLHLVYLLHIVTTLLFIVLAIVNVAISLGSSHPPLHSDGSPSPNLGAFPSYITSPVDCNITPVLRSRTEPSPPAACGCACHVRHRPRTPLRATISSLASAGRTSFFGTLILVS